MVNVYYVKNYTVNKNFKCMSWVKHRDLLIHPYDQYSLSGSHYCYKMFSLALHLNEMSNHLISNIWVKVLGLLAFLIQVSTPTFNTHINSCRVFRTCYPLNPPHQWQLWACLYTDAASSDVNYPAAALQAQGCSFALRRLCVWAQSEECGNTW